MSLRGLSVAARILAAVAVMVGALNVASLAPVSAATPVNRVGGSTHAGPDLAIAISRGAIEDHQATDVVLADARDQSHALTVGSLIGALPAKAPVLFTAADDLSHNAVVELNRVLPAGAARGGTRVYVVGPSISNHVLNQVHSMGVTVERLAGTTPTGTAALIASRFYPSGGTTDTVLIVAPGNWAAGATAGAWAAAKSLPMLLAGSGDTLPAQTRGYLQEATPARVLLVGGRSLISLAQEHAIEAMGIEVRRASGSAADQISNSVASQWANTISVRGAKLQPTVMSVNGPAPAALAAAVIARSRFDQAAVSAPLLLTGSLVGNSAAACAKGQGRIAPCYLMGSAAGRLTVVGDTQLVSAATANVLADAATRARFGNVPNFSHVFIVVLENEDYDAVLGPGGSAEAPYLNGLADSGSQATSYFAVDHNSLANYVALVSGQPSTAATRNDCPQYNCVFAESVRHIGDQMDSAGLSWKAYLDGMNTPCQHPPTQGAGDIYFVQGAPPGNTYATRHNPFMYFSNMVDHQARCDAHDVPYPSLATDLAGHHVPKLSLIVPDLCHDGHDNYCINGGPGGMASADIWLSTEMPRILASPEYRSGGVLIITFDEAESSDTTGCCAGSKGGHVGFVVLSPTWGREAGFESTTPTDHYGLLRTLEDAWGLPRLGKAADPLTTPLTDLFRVTPAN